MKTPDKIKRLVEIFDRNLEAYKSSGYKEANVRSEFINPFFEALGWDVQNWRGYAEAYKDVISEDAIKVGGVTKAPDSIRCVVSVSMLTEGWDANTVTHVLGIRAFGTQLLCEQVIGRALRRQSYDLNEDGMFNIEYADVLGIPFNFTAKPVVAPPQPPRQTIHVNFTTSRTNRWQTDSRRCHINWIILDSDWEAELCRVAESHPKVRAYAKNHCLGFEVPYRYGSEIRPYRPDFIVMVDDGRKDLLHLIVEIKGYRREDAKEKKAVMETYWVPGVNHLGTYGRWAFAEFTDVYEIESSFSKMIEDACVEEV